MRTDAARSGSAGAEQPARDDEGFTLVELLVVMMLMGILGTLLLSTFTTQVDATRTVERRGDDVQEVRIAMDTMSRTVRTAIDPDGRGAGADAATPRNAFVSAGPTELTFYANINVRDAAAGTIGLPTLVSYTLDDGVMTETRTPGTRAADGQLDWPAAGAAARVIARDVVDIAGRSRFEFVLERCPLVAGTPTCTTTTVSDSDIVATDYDDVQAVQVRLAVSSGDGTPVEAVQTLTLPNAG